LESRFLTVTEGTLPARQGAKRCYPSQRAEAQGPHGQHGQFHRGIAECLVEAGRWSYVRLQVGGANQPSLGTVKLARVVGLKLARRLRWPTLPAPNHQETSAPFAVPAEQSRRRCAQKSERKSRWTDVDSFRPRSFDSLEQVGSKDAR